ncbi:ABC transporter substrate-binding protein [Paenibacillus typhae]|uniref:Carbohydrate ABC transporter substrate-binding protein, CUT1 family n=1 Tax=Paenibacillus typhae TaxID=1174501 RepID=A0A1G8TUB3_9BACL|nr:extracellular solute-binding protein [Paenibacillus typhae]SDJ45063.1 carbohydrate ABC transporter substrate-binding protein, CUT1 family [Paenibacillus typhae]
MGIKKGFWRSSLWSLSLLAVLAGCGSNAAPDSNTSAAGTATNAAGGDAEKEPVVLKLTTWNPISQTVVDKFQEKYPYITIEHDKVYDQFREIIRTRIVSKSDMDMLWLFPNQVAEFSKEDVLMDITGSPWLDNYLEAAVKLGTVDGKTYGVPYNSQPIVMFYNKTLFGELGLEIPKTWDELLAVSEEIKASGTAPMVIGSKDGWATQFITTSQFGLYQHDNPDVFAQLASGEKKWTDPEFSTYFDGMKELADKGYLLENSVGLSYDQVAQVFKEGKAAMWPMGEWGYSENFDADFSAFELGAFPIPVNRGDQPLVTNLVSDNLLVGVSWSKHQEEIKLFMEFVADPEIAKIWSGETKQAVTVKGGTSETYSPLAASLQPLLDASEAQIFASMTSSIEPVMFPIFQQILLKQDVNTAKLLEQMQAAQDKDI